MDSVFQEIWNLHWRLNLGIFTKEIRKSMTFNFYLSEVPGPYFNFAVPTVSRPEELDMESVEKNLWKDKKTPSCYLLEHHQTSGFTEFLIRKGLRFQGTDTWMIFNPQHYSNVKINSEITPVTPKNFADFYAVLSTVFKDFTGNEKYLEICRNSIEGEFANFTSELFLIYEKGKPAAGAGLLYSKRDNIAYLHNDGTLEKFRGKGYQGDLIRYRTNRALEAGIKKIYAIVEHGGRSWLNYMKAGFNQKQMALILVGK